MSYNLVDPTTGDLTKVAGGIDTSIIPSNASASNKLVTHQVPYELFTLNNNSGSQKWYKLGKYEEGNYTARLDFVSARVDGQMFESSVRMCGIGTDSNFVSWIGEKGCEISTIAVKVDSARNLYIKMNSYSAVEIRVYGTFTLDIVEQSSEPSGVQIVLNVLATMDKLKFVPSTVLNSGFKVVAYSDREITGNSKLECLENWITNALSKYTNNSCIIGNIYNDTYVDGFAIVNVWGEDTKGIIGASGLIVDQEGVHYYRKLNGTTGSGTITRII